MRNPPSNLRKFLDDFGFHFWEVREIRDGDTCFRIRECRCCPMVEVYQSSTGKWFDQYDVMLWRYYFERQSFDRAMQNYPNPNFVRLKP